MSTIDNRIIKMQQVLYVPITVDSRTINDRLILLGKIVDYITVGLDLFYYFDAPFSSKNGLVTIGRYNLTLPLIVENENNNCVSFELSSEFVHKEDDSLDQNVEPMKDICSDSDMTVKQAVQTELRNVVSEIESVAIQELKVIVNPIQLEQTGNNSNDQIEENEYNKTECISNSNIQGVFNISTMNNSEIPMPCSIPSAHFRKKKRTKWKRQRRLKKKNPRTDVLNLDSWNIFIDNKCLSIDQPLCIIPENTCDSSLYRIGEINNLEQDLKQFLRKLENFRDKIGKVIPGKSPHPA